MDVLFLLLTVTLSKARRKDWSYRRKHIQEFVWVISLFWLYSLLSICFCCFLHLLSPPSQVTYLRIYIHIYISLYIYIYMIFCVIISWVNNRKHHNLLQFNSTHFFLQATLFFNSASVLLRSSMNWSSNVAYVLLNTYNLHYTFYILYLVYLCPCLDLDPFILYICDLFFVFSLILGVINNVIKTDALVFRIFLRISPTI